MTDHTDHRAAAERMLADADEWTAQAWELSPEASELSCLAYAQVHALLAIHDTLTAADRHPTNEERQREEAKPDPLDEDNHRDRQDCDGMRLIRVGPQHWHPSSGALCGLGCNGLSLANWNSSYGPLAFAPEPPQEATGDDQSAPEGESGPVEGPATDNAQNAILCPECGDHINAHDTKGCRRNLCDCPRDPEDVARPLIADAVNTERDRLTDQLRATTNSVIAELDELAAWETHTDG